MDKIEFNKVKLENLDSRLSRLDDFNDFYGWGIYKNGHDFILYDEQTGEIKDMIPNLLGVIDRVCGRALDYWLEEHEFDYEMIHLSDYKMIGELLFIYQLFIGTSDFDYSKTWYDSKLKSLKELKIRD